ncbi:hypothetical protein MMC12_001079, partial [Toensbergia leucococca]|nr:hypothetical protein [Toensbergia leucococca]
MSSKPPQKAMSSRLLTMKFMQRAAASQPSPTPSFPPSKRQKTSPSSSTTTSTSTDLLTIRAALEAEEEKRSQALERQGAEAGETKWYFSLQDGDTNKRSGLSVKLAGYGDIDSSDRGGGNDEREIQVAGGRRSFGKFNREVE